jgi:hypothetical protein
MSASDVIARLRELHAEHLKAAGPFKAPRNRRPLDHLRLAELDRDFVAAASVALPALLECAEALEDLADMVSEAGQYMTAQSGMTAARLGESRDKARAALDALSKDTP